MIHQKSIFPIYQKRLQIILKKGFFYSEKSVMIWIGKFDKYFKGSAEMIKPDTGQEKYIDHITGGGNEFWLKKMYDELCWYKMSKYTFLVLNIKRFRRVNDKFGRKGADEILKEVYDAVSAFLNEDECIARLYADSFGILLKRKDKQELVQFVYDSDMGVYSIEDRRIFNMIYLSYGMYMINDPGDDYYTAVEKADLCRVMSEQSNLISTLYEFYEPSFTNKFRKEYELEERARGALERGEFTAYLQPKVRLSDEKIVGAEVLLRWFGPDGKLVPIMDYLQHFNENGFLREVDMYIFEKMCKLLDQRIKENKPIVPLSFNISKANFNDEDFTSFYMYVFEEYDIPVKYIEFELLESSTLDNQDRLSRLVPVLKSKGFTCLLDDFGTGYSSFQVVSNIDLDILKLDRQFFIKEFNERDCRIIETIITFAHQLGLEVVAEGVEQKAYIDFLKEIGCDMVQGFYYYKPMPVDEFMELLARQEEK